MAKVLDVPEQGEKLLTERAGVSKESAFLLNAAVKLLTPAGRKVCSWLSSLRPS